MINTLVKTAGVLGVLIVAGSAAAQAQSYNFKYFQDPSPNAFSTIGTDLSPTGELVGWYTNFANGVWGFSETNGTYKTISVPTSGSPYTVINAIGDGGKLVGYGPFTGFVMDSSGNLTTIAVPASWKATSFSNPTSINSSGVIVGNVTTASVSQEGFILEGGTYRAYQVPGSYSTSLNDVNDNGVIVGSYETNSNGGNAVGFILNNGALTSVKFPGATSTVATSINATGDVVGYFYNQSQILLPFYFDGTTYTQIATPGEYACTPHHIKNSGDIVGTCSNSSTRVTQAFVGTPASE